MNILITGISKGIGQAICKKFLQEGHIVYGFDKLKKTINHQNYHHYQIDISKDQLIELPPINILINNAGIQTNSELDVSTNLLATIKVTEKYAFQAQIKSVLFIASNSGTTGSEFPYYASSKGGVIAYMKNVAIRLGKYKATSNSLSPGGVITELNKHIIDDKKLYQEVLNETLLDKWASVDEIAEWSYFITTINQSMTGQDIIIDNGEVAKYNFVW